MASLDNIPPLDWQFPIVDPNTGRPSPQFIRLWQQMFGNGSKLNDDLATKVPETRQVIAGTGLTGGGPLSSDVTLTANTQAILNQISTTQGAVIYRNATQWVALPPGTSGQLLTTGGAAANPSWTTITSNIQTLLDGIGSTRGSILYRGASGWAILTPGTSGYALISSGAGADPNWSPVSTSSGANPTATGSDTAVNGVATTFMRSDAAPAIQKASSSQFGLVKVDGTTITASGGVISSTGGGGGGGSGSAVLGPAWTALTFSSTSTILGATRYGAGQTFTPAAENRVELEINAHNATGTGISLGFTNGTNGYYVSLQSDNNLVLYKYVSGTTTALSALGAAAANNWNGVYNIVFILVPESTTSNRLRVLVNGKAFPDSNTLTSDGGANMVGTLTPFVTNDAIAKVSARARLVVGGESSTVNTPASWTRIAQYTGATVASFDVTGLASYTDLMFACRSLTASSSGTRQVHASTDNGSTYWTTSGNYSTLPSTGSAAASSTWANCGTGTVGLWFGGTMLGINTTGDKLCMNTGTVNMLFNGSTLPVTAIRFSNSAGNLNGGNIDVYAR